MKQVTNNKGLTSVESLVGLSTFILVMIVMMRLILFIAEEDSMHHEVMYIANQMEVNQIVSSRIGSISSIDFLPEDYKHLASKLEDVLEKMVETLSVESLISLIDINHVHDIHLESYEINHEQLELIISYEHTFAFIFSRANVIELSYFPRMSGNDASLRELDSLTDYMDKTVYITRTGKKYHIKTCFYITRSTTDQSGVRKMKLKEVKFHYEACKRCIGD
jgi:hypothetical protein